MSSASSRNDEHLLSSTSQWQLLTSVAVGLVPAMPVKQLNPFRQTIDKFGQRNQVPRLHSKERYRQTLNSRPFFSVPHSNSEQHKNCCCCWRTTIDWDYLSDYWGECPHARGLETTDRHPKHRVIHARALPSRHIWYWQVKVMSATFKIQIKTN